MQTVNEAPAAPANQNRRVQSQQAGSAAAPSRAAANVAPRQSVAPASSTIPVSRPIPAAPQIPDGLPTRASETDIHTVIPAAAQLNGDLTIEESIVLRCVVRGNVTQEGDHQVVLTETGGIHGTLRAHTAVIGGTVEGDVFADRVVVLETGIVHGNIEYVTLAMKEGATVNGLLTRTVPNVLDTSEGASVFSAAAAPILHSVPMAEQERVA
ncbi:Integral membrane protein CcmA involved in cell shape determination [Candidatus Burkholderia verschuerenii]|uniref:Integral membrane protein CcmA involved in cell shape determination n=2 Tax=Candidatus Burkholderia verschuerenii TaxID=242163 RepID=A0A0L0MJ53_9BURK|nr:Integral membrane protein CcmA involved in cell shape determination [Candidatus Burkholderia verschuerenii]